LFVVDEMEPIKKRTAQLDRGALVPLLLDASSVSKKQLKSDYQGISERNVLNVKRRTVSYQPEVSPEVGQNIRKYLKRELERT